MIRAEFGNRKYWDEQVSLDSGAIKKRTAMLAQESKNPVYDPEYSFGTSRYCLSLILSRYSRGDDINELSQYFAPMLDMWELSNRLSDEICKEHNLTSCRDWVFSFKNLNHYNFCFWLVGLGILLDVDEDIWHRLITLIGDEERDFLLDSIISYRYPNREINRDKTHHQKPYKRLIKAINAPKDKQAILLQEFVENWYKELTRKQPNELWWHMADTPIKRVMELGVYNGHWCIEAAVCAKVFDIDDSLCLNHPHYPKALLHKETAKEKSSFLSRLISRFRG